MPAQSHAVGSKEVVPRASQLTIDLDGAARAFEDLVAQAKRGIPCTAVGTSLRGSRLSSDKDAASRKKNGSRDQPLTKQVMAPGVHSASHFASKVAFCLQSLPTLGEFAGSKLGKDNKIMLVEQESGGIVVSRLDVTMEAPVLLGQLALQSSRRAAMSALHSTWIHIFTTALRENHEHWSVSTAIQSRLKLVNAVAALTKFRIPIIEECTELARGGRKPFLERSAARVGGNDTLVHEVRIRVVRLTHFVRVDEVERVGLLLPLNLGVLLQAVPFSNHSLNDTTAVLH